MESSFLNNSLEKKENLETGIHNSSIFCIQNPKFSFRVRVAVIRDGRLMTLFLFAPALKGGSNPKEELIFFWGPKGVEPL